MVVIHPPLCASGMLTQRHDEKRSDGMMTVLDWVSIAVPDFTVTNMDEGSHSILLCCDMSSADGAIQLALFFSELSNSQRFQSLKMAFASQIETCYRTTNGQDSSLYDRLINQGRASVGSVLRVSVTLLTWCHRDARYVSTRYSENTATYQRKTQAHDSCEPHGATPRATRARQGPTRNQIEWRWK